MKVITVGRSSDNDIVINDSTVSRTHLQIVQKDGEGCSVVDLNSANGTYVNGEKICGEVRLRPNDIIRIGNTTLPWQEYIKVSTGKQKVVPPSTKNNRLWLWVAICAVIMLIGGIGLYVCHNNKEGKKQEQEEKAYKAKEERLYQEIDNVESKRKQDNVDSEQYLKRVREDRDEKQKIADQKTEQAKIYEKKAKAESEKARKAEEKAKAESEKARKAEEKAKAESEKAIKAEKAKAESEKARKDEKAKAESDVAKQQAKRREIQQEFDKEFDDIDDGLAKEICKQLNIKYKQEKVLLFNNGSDAKDKLRERFNSSNYEYKKKIIDTIKSIKGKDHR